MVDWIWRQGLRVAYALLRLWWFVRRPVVHGGYVAVWSGEKLLVIRNSYRPGYTVPCGGLRRRESPEEAARRELCEEVGISADLTSLVFAGEVVVPFEFKEDHAHFFELCLDELPQIRVDGREVVEARMCTEPELNALPLVPHVREYLERRASARRLRTEVVADAPS